ncbi:MAG: hypothetical protein D6723_11285 [Acidobacteria bacterium]|nr:MAG: hypothetical protein D6723_11285 [Acidobacteriota bacterium]
MLRSFLVASIVLSSLSLGLPAQDNGRVFKDPHGAYMLVLRDRWEPVTYKDGAGHTVVDIIYENRERGLLRIRKRHVDREMTPEEFARRMQETSFQFRPGFTRGSLEPFNRGPYPGALLTFDFTYGGRPKTARYYYLKVDPHTFYVLQFEGNPQVLRTMRNRTDLMAQSFRVLG